MKRSALFLLLLLALVGCGSSSRSAAHTVTFKTAGTFPTATIVGHYSAQNCARDAAEVTDNAREFYRHSTGGLGPADAYFYDTRFAYATFTADGCTPEQLGTALAHGLTRRQQQWLIAHLSSNLAVPFRAALSLLASPAG